MTYTNISTIRAAAMAAMMATTAAADDLKPDSFAVLLGSNHIGAARDFEEHNPGLFLSFDGDIANTRIGAYRNSFGDMSVAVTWASDHLTVSGAGFNVTPFAGGAYYPEGAEASPIELGEGNIVPLVGVEAWHDDIPVFVQWLPGDRKVAGYDSLVTFGLRMDF